MPGFYIIVVGSDQQTKCQLLNAMARQRGRFSQFSCRRNPVVKSVKNVTVSGHMLNLVLTPSMGTPAWAKVENNFNAKDHWKTPYRSFVYIKSDPSSIDDVSAIKVIKDKFGEKSVRTVASYFGKGDTHLTDDEHFKFSFDLGADFLTQVQQTVPILSDFLPANEDSMPSQIGGKAFTTNKTIRRLTSEEKEEIQSSVSSVKVPDAENQKNVWSFDEIMTFPEHIHDDNFTHSGRHIPIALTDRFLKQYPDINKTQSVPVWHV